MSTYSRLTQVFKNSKEIDFDNKSKIIFFSDCHRGDGSWADIFLHNQNLFHHALTYYYKEGYTYIEIGDGDELWENRKFQDIKQVHSDAFWLMQKFYDENRLYVIWGNHDLVKRNMSFVKNNIYRHRRYRTGNIEPLLDGIKFHEGLILKYCKADNKLFVVHGHQGDFLNDNCWPLGRFLVRYVWRPLALLGFKDLTSAAKNHLKTTIVESKIAHWVQSNKQPLIAGHTHRPMFPEVGKTPYFNDGSCVHPRCISGIEIQNGEIALIKWSVKTRNDGILYVGKDIIAGPNKLEDYFGVY